MKKFKPSDIAAMVADRMAHYDDKCGEVGNWLAAEKREKTEGAVLLNAQKRLEAEQMAGRLITKEDFSKRQTALVEKFMEIIQSIPSLMSDQCTVPADRPMYSRAGAAVRSAVIDMLREQTKDG